MPKIFATVFNKFRENTIIASRLQLLFTSSRFNGIKKQAQVRVDSSSSRNFLLFSMIMIFEVTFICQEIVSGSIVAFKINK